ncbi:MAG: hypothetical protein AAFU79_01540 [Myxococcota bacterium]
MDTRKAAVGIFALTLTTLAASESRADRIRTCRYEMTDTVVLVDRKLDVLGSFDEAMVGNTAGRHGGTQANTARGRARDRFNTCRDRWVNRGERPSSINECNNANAGSGTGADVLQQSDNLTHSDYLIDAFRLEVCAFVQARGLDPSSLSLVLITNRSGTSGDNRCGSSRDQDMGRFGRFVTLIEDLCP